MPAKISCLLIATLSFSCNLVFCVCVWKSICLLLFSRRKFVLLFDCVFFFVAVVALSTNTLVSIDLDIRWTKTDYNCLRSSKILPNHLESFMENRENKAKRVSNGKRQPIEWKAASDHHTINPFVGSIEPKIITTIRFLRLIVLISTHTKRRRIRRKWGRNINIYQL